MFFALPRNPPALSSPEYGLACSFVLDLAFVGTLTSPEAKALRSIAALVAEIELRKRRFTIQPYTSAEVLPASIDPASRCRKIPPRART
jgi:hypothetical protein